MIVGSPAAAIDRAVQGAINTYFKDLDGLEPIALYELVMHCVEKPLLENVMQRVHGNQVKAAAILGINRNTLRKKLRAHRFMKWVKR